MRSVPACLLLFTGLAQASPPAIQVCHDYGCKAQTKVQFSDKEWQQIGALFSPAAASAPVERQRIAEAIALMEAFSGQQIGPQTDLRENYEGSGLPGQMDCIDESRNTTSYLQLLSDAGWLQHHRVGERAYRAPWIFDQHWTATVNAKDGGAWAIDSWFLDNGRQPYVQALPAWLDKDDLPYNPDAEG